MRTQVSSRLTAMFLWCSILWRPLHFWHLDPWVWHVNVVCPYLQQFLHWGTPGFILVPLIVVMWWLMLKHLLIRILPFVPFWESQVLIHITAMLDLGDALMMHRHEANITSFKMWVVFKFLSIMSWVKKRLVSSIILQSMPPGCSMDLGKG